MAEQASAQGGGRVQSEIWHVVCSPPKMFWAAPELAVAALGFAAIIGLMLDPIILPFLWAGGHYLAVRYTQKDPHVVGILQAVSWVNKHAGQHPLRGGPICFEV